MSRDNYIKIIGDELWFDGMKVGTLHEEGIPASTVAALRLYLSKVLNNNSVREWRP
jgi:hypothetical protein